MPRLPVGPLYTVVCGREQVPITYQQPNTPLLYVGYQDYRETGPVFVNAIRTADQLEYREPCLTMTIQSLKLFTSEPELASHDDFNKFF